MDMTNLDTNANQADAGCAGLCLRLGQAQLKALGLDKHPPAPGAQVSIRALATVRNATDVEEAGEGAEAEGAEEKAEGSTVLELHLSKLDVTHNGREPASVLYGGKG